tara:strand:+ start:439 stop:1614 length:1176 start_codon:yes stop_codon:yes gene_type:complete
MIDKAKNIRALIVFGLVISTFTQLRFSFLGIGEVIFLMLGGIALIQLWHMPGYKHYLFVKFWLFYLILAVIGGLYNRAADLNTGSLVGEVFDFSAYFMLLISCLSIEKRFLQHRDNAYLYIKAIFYFFTCFVSVFYFLSFFTGSIAGFQIRYYQYFAPLVNNLHQVAMVLTPLPFIGLLILTREKQLATKMIVLVLIVLTVLMIIATGASKAKLGLILGLAGYSIAQVYRYSFSYTVILTTIVFSILAVFFTFFVDIFAFFTALFNQHDGHGGRADLYGAAIELIKESWLLGRGAGAHILHLGEYNDSHQTLLTVMLQVGIVGFALLIHLLFKILQKGFYWEPTIFAAILSIMSYAAGGDILRRLPIWGVLIILYYIALQSQESQLTREKK